jgi:hypothetical protein
MSKMKPKKAVTKKQEEPEESEEKTGVEIPQNTLLKFVGHVPNMLKIDQHNLWDNRYRINVWTQRYIDESVVPTNRIEKSFFIHFVNGKIIDKTIK